MYKEELLDFVPAKSNFKDTCTKSKRCIITDRTIKNKQGNSNMILLLKRTTGNKM